MAAVVFDVSMFKVRYPEFSMVSSETLQVCFDEATGYLDNTDASRISSLARRQMLLNMLTAHIASLGGALSADGQPRPVGRVSTATKGSVTVGLEYVAPGTSAWFNQTPYGASFWQATINLRGFRYIPGGYYGG